MEKSREKTLTLVATKPCFGLPTACPNCLPVYFYLKFAKLQFDLCFHSTFPDSDQIPYVESGSYVAYNNEKGGVINCLREDGIVDLDSDFRSIPEWISMKAMISSWLVDALVYELWIASDKTSVQKIYFSDLPWPIGTILYFKQILAVKRHLGITNENAERIESEIYSRANLAYGALSTQLGETSFLFGDRPSSLDASFLGHALIALQALPEASVLKSKLLNFSNLVKYTEKLSNELINGSAQSAVPNWSRSPSSSGQPSSSIDNPGEFSNWSSKPKSKPKKERTEEEKKFRRRAKYFLAAQLISVLVFLSLFSASDSGELEFDENDEVDYMN
ncbi:mitochondrial outer membrane import complex protein METAXIN [Amaranthus tricolor]|uniref:mitochondrial outer membrane import complex protein METAXIN n=1 Tax=Amaranthus tricolor TaxID=29722 RepID=UPI00258BF240|nr:mitochondrial outer membrane import complex protein METAXIN [Amaranthus tricolor]